MHSLIRLLDLSLQDVEFKDATLLNNLYLGIPFFKNIELISLVSRKNYSFFYCRR